MCVIYKCMEKYMSVTAFCRGSSLPDTQALHNGLMFVKSSFLGCTSRQPEVELYWGKKPGTPALPSPLLFVQSGYQLWVNEAEDNGEKGWS